MKIKALGGWVAIGFGLACGAGCTIHTSSNRVHYPEQSQKPAQHAHHAPARPPAAPPAAPVAAAPATPVAETPAPASAPAATTPAASETHAGTAASAADKRKEEQARKQEELAKKKEELAADKARKKKEREDKLAAQQAEAERKKEELAADKARKKKEREDKLAAQQAEAERKKKERADQKAALKQEVVAEPGTKPLLDKHPAVTGSYAKPGDAGTAATPDSHKVSDVVQANRPGDPNGVAKLDRDKKPQEAHVVAKPKVVSSKADDVARIAGRQSEHAPAEPASATQGKSQDPAK